MKADLHIHSKYSPDSFASLNTIFKTAKKRGFDAIAITDHNTCRAWKDARNASKKHGVLFIPGVEVSSVDEYGNQTGHVLGFFLEEEITKTYYYDLFDQIHDKGGIVSLAHPFSTMTGSPICAASLRTFGTPSRSPSFAIMEP